MAPQTSPLLKEERGDGEEWRDARIEADLAK